VDFKFKASLHYIVNPYLKIKNRTDIVAQFHKHSYSEEETGKMEALGQPREKLERLPS
jgi:hypothetical protein